MAYGKTARLDSALALVAIGLMTSAACGRALPAQGTAGGASRASAPQAGAPQIERPIPFDSAGRLMVMAPSTAARLSLPSSVWPVTGAWSEARLYRADNGPDAMAAVLIANLADGAIARYPLGADALVAMRRAIDAGLRTNAATLASARGTSSGVVRSEPAGNTFVRNQIFLGLAAYGPATAAMLSDDGTAAAGGYLLAAGSAFFVAAQMTRTRSVTRAQTILATHGGFRGAAAGAAIASIGNAHGGPGYGIPILIGALGGTAGGFMAARGMSDGEAASSGLAADMLALTTIGVSQATGMFDDGRSDSKHKAALGTAVAAGGIGYVIGPHYARRAAYNVTSGDANVALTGSLLGALAGSAISDTRHDNQHKAAAFATAGLLGGFVMSDRFLVRLHDRSSSDATWATFGAIAGGLMGGGVAVISKAPTQGTLGLVALGGALGLIAADRTIAPAPDAGPLRGVLRSSLVPSREEHVRVSVAPTMKGVSVRVTF